MMMIIGVLMYLLAILAFSDKPPFFLESMGMRITEQERLHQRAN